VPSGLFKSTWYYQRRQKVEYTVKHGKLPLLLAAIAREHPKYDYRRTTSESLNTYDVCINHKVVQRLHQLCGLKLQRTTRLLDTGTSYSVQPAISLTVSVMTDLTY